MPTRGLLGMYGAAQAALPGLAHGGVMTTIITFKVLVLYPILRSDHKKK